MKIQPRLDIKNFIDIPNIGRAIERDLRQLGLNAPQDLIGRDPYQLYESLMQLTGTKQDPCVCDVFISAVRYMEGWPKKNWWEYTAERKKMLPRVLQERVLKK
jgi:hypothetical protein